VPRVAGNVEESAGAEIEDAELAATGFGERNATRLGQPERPQYSGLALARPRGGRGAAILDHGPAHRDRDSHEHELVRFPGAEELHVPEP
jgi:hypothetical protein